MVLAGGDPFFVGVASVCFFVLLFGPFVFTLDLVYIVTSANSIAFPLADVDACASIGFVGGPACT